MILRKKFRIGTENQLETSASVSEQDGKAFRGSEKKGGGDREKKSVRGVEQHPLRDPSPGPKIKG